MSGEGPDSVPTSADPRSHRPTKKRALTPVSAQAASVDALFAKPDQDIRVPSTSDLTVARTGRNAPPEIVTNVQGSSAGAGSGEFHVYKASRRREYERLRDMDNELRREQDVREFDKDKADRDRRDEEKTRKNREKRNKMKARRANKGKPSSDPSSQANPSQPSQSQPSGHRPPDESTPGALGNEILKPSTEAPGLVIHDDG